MYYIIIMHIAIYSHVWTIIQMCIEQKYSIILAIGSYIPSKLGWFSVATQIILFAIFCQSLLANQLL